MNEPWRMTLAEMLNVKYAQALASRLSANQDQKGYGYTGLLNYSTNLRQSLNSYKQLVQRYKKTIRKHKKDPAKRTFAILVNKDNLTPTVQQLTVLKKRMLELANGVNEEVKRLDEIRQRNQ